MREIKFRVPVVCQNGHKAFWGYRPKLFSDSGFDVEHFPPRRCGCPTFALGEGWRRAGADQQYTGLKDKDGVEIYEGDIFDINGLLVVHYKVDGFYGVQVVPHDAMGIYGWCPLRYIASESAVLGNIHENPELLDELLDEDYAARRD